MNSKEVQQLKEETFATYGKQIEALKGSRGELCFAVDDKKIKDLSDTIGYFLLGKLKNFAVRVFKNAKGVVYVLLLSAFLNEGLESMTPRTEDRLLIAKEYSQIASWEDR